MRLSGSFGGSVTIGLFGLASHPIGARSGLCWDKAKPAAAENPARGPDGIRRGLTRPIEGGICPAMIWGFAWISAALGFLWWFRHHRSVRPRIARDRYETRAVLGQGEAGRDGKNPARGPDAIRLGLTRARPLSLVGHRKKCKSLPPRPAHGRVTSRVVV